MCTVCLASGVQPAAEETSGAESDAEECDIGKDEERFPFAMAAVAPGQHLITLESRCEYMLQFLEYAKSGQIDVPQDRYDKVIAAIKATFSWKKAERSDEEYAAKVQELDALMTATTSGLF